MKSFILFVLITTLFTITNIYSQDIKAKIKGHLAEDGFTVVDDNDKVLFRVTGEGNAGINTPTPSYLFQVQGSPSSAVIGRGINLVGEYGTLNGGGINLQGGYGERDGGSVSILAGDSDTGDGTGGSVSISGGVGAFGGSVNISTAGGYLNRRSGLININTGNNLEGGSGSLAISTGIGTDGVSSGAGQISISTGDDNGPRYTNHLNLKTGYNSWGGGDIILEVSSGRPYWGSGNIILTPHTSGLVIVNGSGTYSGTWTQASDVRFKKNIEPLFNSVDKIQQLNGVSYEFRNDEFPDKNFTDGKQIGLIAQDVEKVFPELVETDSDGYKSIAYQNMVAVLIEAVKEQQKSIDELKKEVEKLKSNQIIEVTTNTSSKN